MSCPDINDLVDLLVDPRPDPELEAHTRGCESCRADLGLLREIPVALRAPAEMPERLIGLVMRSLDAQLAEPSVSQPPVGHLAVSGLLGAITALLAVFAGGGQANPVDLLLFSLAGGLCAVAVHARRLNALEVRD